MEEETRKNIDIHIKIMEVFVLILLTILVYQATIINAYIPVIYQEGLLQNKSIIETHEQVSQILLDHAEKSQLIYSLLIVIIAIVLILILNEIRKDRDFKNNISQIKKYIKKL